MSNFDTLKYILRLLAQLLVQLIQDWLKGNNPGSDNTPKPPSP